MANQAIALQARAPQGNFLAPALQQGAQFINMMSQQRAAERQAAVAQQTMEIQRAAEAREAAKAGRDKQTFELDLPGKIYEKHRALGSVAAEGGAPAYAQWLEAYGQDDPKVASVIAKAMPVDQFDPDRFTRMLATMDQRFEARYGKAIIKEFIGQDGTLLSGNFSGLPGASYVTRTPDITSTLKAPPPAAPTPPAANVKPMAAPQTPAPAAGGMFQPISATGGQPQGADPQAALLASLNEAKRTGQISPDVVEQLRQLGGPQAGPRVDAFLAQNNIKVAPGGMRSAIYRPDGGASMAQQVQYNPNDFPTARVKSPMQSPAPGIYSVPTPQIAGAAAAEAGGTQGVRVVTEPKIVAGTERVKRLEKLRGDQPLALSDAKSVITDMDDRIAAIDEFLRSPNRRSIIGAVEGRIPRIAQNERRADVQALYDSIVSNQVLNELIKGRQQTETGASPQGIVSDKDLAIAAQASNRLTQTGSEEVQEREMQRLRDVLYRTRQLAIKTYGDTYREVAKDAPELRLDVAPIADTYKAFPETPAAKTPVTKPPPGVSAAEWKAMSPKERKLWPQ